MDPKDDQIYLDKVGRGGWNVIGRTPETENVSTVDENNRSVTTQRPTGNIVWTITDGKGHNQQMTVAGSIPAANADSVVKPPADLPKESTTATPAAGLERLDANLQPIPAGSSTPTVYVRDPAAPAGTPPFKVEGDATALGDPTTWTPIKNPNDPNEVIGLFDPQSKKVAASVSAPPNAKPSGVYTNLIDPNDPAGKRVIGMVDTGDKSVHSVATAPDNTQIVATPTAIYTLDKTTGAVINKQDVAAGDVNKQAVTVGGKVYSFDPKTGEFTLPNNVQAAATVGNSTTLKDLVWYDDQGNEVGRTPNPNYGKAPVTAPTPNTVAPMIQVPDPKDPSQLVWIENKGQVVASEALKQLASHLSGQVIDGKISVDEAKALIDASNAKMTNDINQQNADTSKATQIAGAAGNILSNAASNAQTGAGMLNQRVSSATGALTSLVSSAAGSKMTSIPGGVGEGLVNGLQDWVTGLGGGKDVYDTAARMVQAADPKISQDPTLANQAQQTLGNMLALYQKQNGDQPHPLVAATQAANQSVQSGGVTAPTTTPDTTSGLQQGQQTNVGVDQALQQQQAAAALRARGLQNTPQGAAIAAGQTPVATNPPVYPGQYNTAWQQGFISPVGTISTGPNAGNGFVAPLIPV